MNFSPNKNMPAGSGGNGQDRVLHRTSSSAGKNAMKGVFSQPHLSGANSSAHMYIHDSAVRPKLTAKYSYGSTYAVGSQWYDFSSSNRGPSNSYGSSYEDKFIMGNANRRRTGTPYQGNQFHGTHNHAHSHSQYSSSPHISSSRSKSSQKSDAKKSTIKFHHRTNNEISSIDKVNDPSMQGLICAGKTHLGYYKFSTVDNSMTCVHDFITSNNRNTPKGNSWILPNLSKRTKGAKISNIADVKCGFHNYSNVIAICNNSTDISLYDLNRTTPAEDPMIQILSGHTRAINSFDFNMSQTNLIISGGQDGCVKVWDIRSDSMKRQGRSDLNIKTANDSIRDVKWMPSHNFASLPSSADGKSLNISSPGYTFASIHDTGVLLKYDLRQTTQVDKKINAHSGPGLCLNWHPHQDYIATGGRDGKCSLWYVGDRRSTDQSPYSTTFLSSNATTNTSSIGIGYPGNPVASTFIPETTINTGSPITKLKFRPNYDKIALNSLIALSSMGDEAEVNIYSLARKYIPKHLLTTGKPSLGLVWWNSNLIFNVDSAGYINGWDITNEPTVLDELPKNIVRWRDVDGSGLLFLNQDTGSYEVSDQDELIDLHTFQKQSSSTVKGDTATPGIGLMANIKRGLSHNNVSHFPTERPIPKRSAFSNISKVPISSSTQSSVNKSSTSLSTLATQDELLENKFLKSPLVIPFELPEAYQYSRESKIMELNKRSYIPKVSSVRGSNIEVFKFLARELEFSFRQDKNNEDDAELSRQQSVNEENIRSDLMKRFDISENATWANIVKDKSNKTRERANSISIKQSPIVLSDESEIKSPTIQKLESGDNNVKYESNITKEIQQEKTKNFNPEYRINLLLELVESSNHNASVYSIIDDLPNFKIWMLIRDSLLWDIKMYSSFSENETPEELTGGQLEYPLTNTRKQSLVSDLSRLGTSELSSDYAEHPHAYHGKSDYSSDASEGIKSPVSKLGEQLKGEESNKFVLGRRLSSMSPKRSPDIPKLAAALKIHRQRNENNRESEIESSAIEEEEEDEEEDDDKFNDDEDFKGPATTKDNTIHSIPILNKREARTSFIDTFMTNENSPDAFHNVPYLNKNQSPGYGYSSPKNKNGPSHSFANTPSKLAFLKKLSPRTMSSHSVTRAPSSDWHVEHDPTLQVPPPEKKGAPDNLPPWNTTKLLRQIHANALEMGNVILAVNVLILFQDVYNIAPISIVKESVVHFVRLLHQYELFEIAAAILKYCPWDDLLGPEGDQSTVEIFCERCGELITNEQGKDLPHGYWYCQACNRTNTLCVVCNTPLRKLTMAALQCGHEGHFECFTQWFITEGMSECPAGCTAALL